VSAAAHDLMAARRAARLGVAAVFVSPVFASNSPSAARPLGPIRLAMLVRQTPAAVYALGGVNTRTAKRLTSTHVAGVAAVEALA
jgi:thiamine-phosphate pyrophosphorylase